MAVWPGTASDWMIKLNVAPLRRHDWTHSAIGVHDSNSHHRTVLHTTRVIHHCDVLTHEHMCICISCT